MFKVEKYNNRYATKEVFDVYFCNDEKTIYCYDTVREISFSNKIINGRNYFILNINNGPIGNIEDWLNLVQDINNGHISKIYLRGTKRLISTCEDFPLCIVIDKTIEKATINNSLTPAGVPFDFNMQIYFTQYAHEIESYACPEKIVTENCKIGILEPDKEKIKEDKRIEEKEFKKKKTDYSRFVEA